jgi:hypothetical protein
MLGLPKGVRLDAALTAANSMYRALRLMNCTCAHNVPYAGCKIKQVVLVACGRCKALSAWESIAPVEIVGPVCGVLVEVFNESDSSLDTADGPIAQH